MQKFKIDRRKKSYKHNPEFNLENEAYTSQGFYVKNESPNLGQSNRPSDNEQKNENLLSCGLYRSDRWKNEDRRQQKNK